ncbi:cysteine hydrolase family protein [Paracraurococcus ruber]|uniref:Cysteine hydrolase n=1 Tax=Paracraurococcus ruber TaxID=77675 RepID=A0ABS1D5Y4_9PROT|nr:cysteine hydrolase [Paracraurococcus ruber]MBK1662292.1 cysteine hydrolase [Paracraurococcus ruber]TDG14605.1 isochorismatase family protein [Paracraurococcus ruber]
MPQGQDLITLDARPEPVRIDRARSAILVVDMQNDFGAKGGMFHSAGIDIAPIQRVVEPTARVLDAARAAGLPVVYLVMQYRPDLSDAGAPDGPNRIKHAPLGLGAAVPAPDGGAGRILVEGTWNTAILPRLAPQPGDLVVPKQRYSGFFGTNLDSILRARGIRDLVVTGCTTSVCVDSTVRDAMVRDYRCVVLEDCTAEPIGADLPRGNHAATLLTIQLLFGWISDSGRLLDALRAPGG